MGGKTTGCKSSSQKDEVLWPARSGMGEGLSQGHGLYQSLLGGRPGFDVLMQRFSAPSSSERR